MKAETLNDIFSAIVERRQARVMMVREASRWVPIGAREFYQHVTGMTRTLKEWGVGKGDRVAILSENRPEWAVTDFASFQLGAVVVPIYATLTAQQTGVHPARFGGQGRCRLHRGAIGKSSFHQGSDCAATRRSDGPSGNRRRGPDAPIDARMPGRPRFGTRCWRARYFSR